MDGNGFLRREHFPIGGIGREVPAGDGAGIDPEAVIRRLFPNLDDTQVSCLAENITTDFDPSDVLSLLDECNIQVQDLGRG